MKQQQLSKAEDRLIRRFRAAFPAKMLSTRIVELWNSVPLEQMSNMLHHFLSVAPQLEEEILPRWALVKLPRAMDHVKRRVAQVLGLEHEASTVFTEKGRGIEKRAHARMMAMAICFWWKLGGTEFIGQQFGGRDHGTVVNAHKQIRALISIPGPLQDAYAQVLRLLADDCRRAGAIQNIETSAPPITEAA